MLNARVIIGIIVLAHRLPAGRGAILLAALLGIAIAPVLVTPIPAMVDYVNHLSRMYLLAADGTPEASPFYRVHWAVYPNLAMDLIVPRLARLMSVETATRIFLVTSQILVVTGAAAIEFAVKRRIAISGLVAVLFLYSAPFAWGFLNFEFALGLALWGVALWLALAGRFWVIRLGVHALFVGLLFAGHFFALGIYGFTLGVHELWRAWSERKSFAELAGTTAMLAAPAAIAVAVLLALGGGLGGSGNDWFLGMKPFWPVLVLNGYSNAVSSIEALCLCVLVYRLARGGAIRFASSGAWLAVGLALLYLAIPSRLFDTSFSDIRVLVAAALILPAFLDVTLPARGRMAAGAMMLGLTLVNVGVAAATFASYDTTYHAMIRSFAKVQSGSRVLVGHSGAAEDPPMGHLADYPLYHAPTLAAHYAKALVPTLFTTPGKQPLDVVASSQRLTFSCGGPFPTSVLVSIAHGAPPPVPAGEFVRNWTRDFDYLYVIGDGLAPNPMPELLEVLQTDPRFKLYRIRHDHLVAAKG